MKSFIRTIFSFKVYTNQKINNQSIQINISIFNNEIESISTRLLGLAVDRDEQLLRISSIFRETQTRLAFMDIKFDQNIILKNCVLLEESKVILYHLKIKQNELISSIPDFEIEKIIKIIFKINLQYRLSEIKLENLIDKILKVVEDHFLDQYYMRKPWVDSGIKAVLFDENFDEKDQLLSKTLTQQGVCLDKMSRKPGVMD